jgi:shikimate dehydrogenase
MSMDDVLDESDKIITGGFATVGRYAVIGHPIAQSRSPELHERWFRGNGLPGTYEAVDIDPGELIARAPSLPFEFAGINVTAPHKVSILGYVDRIDRQAEAAGAANLVYRDKDKVWTAGNTDGLGMLRALEEATGETSLGKDIVILGAGGAARAIGAALRTVGIGSLVFVNRSLESAEAVKTAVGGTGVLPLHPDTLQDLEVSADLLINTLPPAADKTLAAMDLEPLASHAVVADINYFVDEPILLRRAESLGLMTVHGRGMFLWQAAISFQAWTGTEPDLDMGRRLLGFPDW